MWSLIRLPARTAENPPRSFAGESAVLEDDLAVDQDKLHSGSQVMRLCEGGTIGESLVVKGDDVGGKSNSDTASVVGQNVVRRRRTRLSDRPLKRDGSQVPNVTGQQTWK